MKPKARFIKSVIETARQSETGMPWTRGTRRSASIASRRAVSSASRIKIA